MPKRPAIGTKVKNVTKNEEGKPLFKVPLGTEGTVISHYQTKRTIYVCGFRVKWHRPNKADKTHPTVHAFNECESHLVEILTP